MPRNISPKSGSKAGRLLLLLLSVGLVLALVWLIAGQWQSSSSRDALDRQRAYSARLYHIDSLLLKVLDAESGIRGYLLTHNPVYLTPYQNGRAEVDDVLELLRASYGASENGFQEIFDELPSLYDARWEIMREAIERGGANEAGSPFGGTGKRLTDQIREIVEELRAQTQVDIERKLLTSYKRFDNLSTMNRLLGAGGLVLLFWLVIALYREEKLRAQLARVLSSENERLHEEVAARTADLTNLASYLTNAREQECARLARIVHDEIGSLMAAARLDASWIARKLADAELRSRLDRLISTLDRVIGIKRQVTADLRPPLLADLGLVEALRSLVQTYAGSEHVETSLDLPDSLGELPAQVSLALYRIAQESLANVHRHADATRAKLTLRQESDKLVLKVEDNGVGFDSDTGHRRRRGLAGMAHRAQMLSGVLSLESAPGRGTVVTVQIPWPVHVKAVAHTPATAFSGGE